MYTPIHLLPQNISEERAKYRSRWDTDEGRKLHDRIIEKIRNGAGMHFLEWDFEAGSLGFLEDELDLKGFQFFQEEFDFPKIDNFYAIDFSYAQFWHTKIKNAVFFNTHMRFVRFYNCVFERCVFCFNHCYACQFEKVGFVNCNFIEHDRFTNSDFADCTFSNSFFPYNVFVDCAFDAKTTIESLPKAPVDLSTKMALENGALSDLYEGISNAYYAHGSVTKARKYRFLQRQAATRYNSQSSREKYARLLSEYLMGHGLRPLRVVSCLAGYFLLAWGLFSAVLGSRDALILTCGALFTFGAKAHLLDSLAFGYQLIYILSSFVGICFSALFVTVLANVLIRDK